MAVRYGMQVLYIDLKGSTKTAAQFVALMRLLGVPRIKVYPREPYDGWRGDAQTLYNRLMQVRNRRLKATACATACATEVPV